MGSDPIRHRRSISIAPSQSTLFARAISAPGEHVAQNKDGRDKDVDAEGGGKNKPAPAWTVGKEVGRRGRSLGGNELPPLRDM